MIGACSPSLDCCRPGARQLRQNEHPGMQAFEHIVNTCRTEARALELGTQAIHGQAPASVNVQRQTDGFECSLSHIMPINARKSKVPADCGARVYMCFGCSAIPKQLMPPYLRGGRDLSSSRLRRGSSLKCARNCSVSDGAASTSWGKFSSATSNWSLSARRPTAFGAARRLVGAHAPRMEPRQSHRQFPSRGRRSQPAHRVPHPRS